MPVFYIIGMLIVGITIYSVIEAVLHHREAMAKIQRTDFVCKVCQKTTRAVVDNKELNGDRL